MPRTPILAPGAIVGPYSHAVVAGDLVFLSGQTPMDPITQQLASGDIDAQAMQCLRNLEVVLHAAGLTFDDVVQARVYLVDMNDFSAMNRAYERVFKPPYPARTTIGVAALPRGARVEMDLVAHRPKIG
jgi:2-iminobutanoate/2-iminopropanoate deaminase